jgi:hypothetical protein
MVIRPIEYSKTFEVRDPFKGVSYWEKMTIGGDISETDNIQDCLQQLKDEVENFHKKSLQPISIVADNVPVPEVEIVKTPKQSMIEAITTCTEVDTLKTFERLAKSKPEFQEAYDNRLKELQSC